MAELTKKQRYWKQHVDAAASFDGCLVDYARKLPAHGELVVTATQRRKRESCSTQTPIYHGQHEAIFFYL